MLSHCLSIQWLVTKQRSTSRTITDKYNKRQDKEDKFYIVLDDKQVIENSDLFFKGKFDSADIQARLKVGDKVKVKTIGYRIHF